MSSIFVQLASYRDPELPRTIASALANARHPEALRFGVCWQHSQDERRAMRPYLDHPQVRIDAVPWQESRGCCWARNRTNGLYGGETYTLQVDAHSRFLPWWDEILIDMLHMTGAEKPVLSSYPPNYSRHNGEERLITSNGVQRLTLGRINRDMTLTMKTEYVKDRSAPGVSHFIAAGMLFTIGRFVLDVPYDPDLYFDGEEINLAIRAFTHGYEIFYPHRNVIHHKYGHGSDKHWTDLSEQSEAHRRLSIKRLRELLVGDPSNLEPYSIGPHATVRDYERWAGVDFRKRYRFFSDPANLIDYEVDLELPLGEIPDSDDYEFFIFCLFVDDREIFRKDIYDPEILSKKKKVFELKTELDEVPNRFMLWPKTRSVGFGKRHMFDLPAWDGGRAAAQDVRRNDSGHSLNQP